MWPYGNEMLADTVHACPQTIFIGPHSPAPDFFKARHARLENISKDFGAPSKSRPGFLARPEKLGRDFRSPLIIRPSFKRRPQSLAEIFQARHVCLEKFGKDLLVPSESRRSVLMRPENISRVCQVTPNSLAEILGARQNPRRIFLRRACGALKISAWIFGAPSKHQPKKSGTPCKIRPTPRAGSSARVYFQGINGRFIG